MSSEEFERVWPEVHDRLLRAVCAWGFDRTTAEDAVAEAAARALSRSIGFADVDEFCRWAFTVARNVARDLSRQSARFVQFDALPERADGYDLGRHVEMRQQWNDTARAIASLSLLDKNAILESLDSEEPAHRPRREAVKHAVRRHRARLRLRAALGHVGGFVAWVRRPRPTPIEWVMGYDRQVAALLTPVLAAAATWVSPPTQASPVPAPVAFESSPTAQAGGHGGAAADDVAQAPGAASPRVASNPAGDDRAVPPPPAPRGVGFRFTPSPSYEEDGTVFAAASQSQEDCEAGPCTWLYKSSDRGATWQPLPGHGSREGDLLLPPAYPRDPRIFVVGEVLAVSEDGGLTFRTLGPVFGVASISPLFSSGDPRIVIGAPPHAAQPPATKYVDGEIGVTPFLLPLPNGAVGVRFWFTPEYAKTRRMLVHALELDVNSLAAGATSKDEALYECTEMSCRKLFSFRVGGPVHVAFPGADTVLVANADDYHKSTDGGRTYGATPGPGGGGWVTNLKALPGGRVIASVFKNDSLRLYTSSDAGTTWQLDAAEVPPLSTLTVLSDGTLLGWTMESRSITCSTDQGRTWHPSCRRRPA